MSLRYLEFDFSDDTDGVCTLDAMASVAVSDLPALRAEIEQVLRWAFEHAGGQRGAPEEGGEWDFDLQGPQEWPEASHWRFDAQRRQLEAPRGAAVSDAGWHTVSLSFSGSEAFCQALRSRFCPAD
jgi:hypothetical protein